MNKSIVFGFARIMACACSDDSSSVSVPESSENTPSAKEDPFDTSKVNLPADTVTIGSSSAGAFPASSATIGTSSSSNDGSETTLTFSGTDVTIANDNGCLEKAELHLVKGTTNCVYYK